MIILDTNILSETLRGEMNPGVVAWLENQPRTALFTTTVNQAELLIGVRQLLLGKRRDQIEQAVTGLIEDFAGRVVAFDAEAADHYANIMVDRRAVGRPISQFDCQIAAITRSRGARLATRNTRDFDGCGIEIVNPFR